MYRTIYFLLLLLVTLQSWRSLEGKLVSVDPSPCAASSTAPPLTLNSVLMGGAEDNVLYQLQPGEHCIMNYSLVRNKVNVTFQGPALVRCLDDKNGLAFINATDITISQLSISRCGLKETDISSFLQSLEESSSIELFFQLSNTTDQYVAVAMGDCLNVHLEDTTIANTEGLGYLGINVLGNSTFHNVSIRQNSPKSCSLSNNDLSTEVIGGGALLVYHDYFEDTNRSAYNLEITESLFLENSYCGFALLSQSITPFYDSQDNDSDVLVYGGGGGLSVLLTQIQYNVSVTVRGCTFRNNTARYGSGAHIQQFTGTPNSPVMFDNCTFESNGLDRIDLDTTIVGSALGFFKDFTRPNYNFRKIRFDYSPSNFSISNSEFYNNSGFTGTVFILSLFRIIPVLDSQGWAIIDRCIFTNNRAVLGSALYVQEWKALFNQRGLNVVLKDVDISYNILLILGDTVSSPEQSPSTVYAMDINITLSGECLIQHNMGSGLLLLSSILYVSDNLTFFNNTGAYGGGVHLEGYSIIVIRENGTLGFYDNQAIIGGAIYASLMYVSVYDATTACFIFFGDYLNQYRNDCVDITQFGAEVIFKGNMASQGSMIYGTTLNGCPWITLLRERYNLDNASANILEILYNASDFTSPFKFDTAPDNVLEVSTPTRRISVQLPGGGSDEAENNSPIDFAPGLIRPLNITTFDSFGHRRGTIVTSATDPSSDIESIIGRNNYEFVDNDDLFKTTDFRIYGSPNETVDVALVGVSSFTRVKLRANIVQCPDGYTQVGNDTNTTCECNSDVPYYKISCTSDGKLEVPIRRWIGRGHDDYLYVGFCPFRYCRFENTIINSSYLAGASTYDVECNEGYHRSGLGCGSCASNYSLALGSYRCLECSNTYTWLLILLFASYGIFLIAVIMFFQLTISDGYLNGVIFFSNILSVYLPQLLDSSLLRVYFIVFYWISLKFGYELCFFEGMTTLSSTALHFVFPCYLYILMFVIIIFAKWSSRFSRLITRHGFVPTKLFATIMVMTYSSLLETCMESLSYLPYHNLDTNRTSYRWLYDPSVEYFRGNHALLASFALLFLLLFLIPSPFIWLFPSIIAKIKRLQRYKPFYDAVWAPLKPQHRYWVSLRMILRVIPLSILIFVVQPLNLLLLTVFLLFLLYLQAVIQPFSGKAQNASDSFFLTMLLLISVVSLYYNIYYYIDLDIISSYLPAIDQQKEKVLVIFVAICYAVLVCIVVWHLMARFPILYQLSLRAWNYILCRKRKERKEKSLTEHRGSIDIHAETAIEYGSINMSEGINTPIKTTFSELREPLLESSGVANLEQVHIYS